MLTRKSYEIIAESIKESTDDQDVTMPMSARLFVSRMCVHLREDNPRFDSIKFKQACGVM